VQAQTDATIAQAKAEAEIQIMREKAAAQAEIEREKAKNAMAIERFRAGVEAQAEQDSINAEGDVMQLAPTPAEAALAAVAEALQTFSRTMSAP
jgi:hypothetical protein